MNAPSKRIQPEVQSSHSVFMTPVHEAVLFATRCPRFEEELRLHLQGQVVQEELLDSEYEDMKTFSNAGVYSPFDTASHPGRNESPFSLSP